jgi:hypothetical protein
MKQRPDIPGQRVADLLPAPDPLNGKGNVVRHGKKYAPVDLSEDPLAFLQYLLRNLQKDRIHSFHQIEGGAPFRLLMQRIDRAPVRGLHPFTDFLPEPDPLADQQIFLIIIHSNGDHSVVIQRLLHSEHTFSPRRLILQPSKVSTAYSSSPALTAPVFNRRIF